MHVRCGTQEQYRGVELILKKSLGLLKALARGNDFVQLRMFERLDILLKIKAVESDVAVALKEVHARSVATVSYTHLTLPTIYSV